jgi:hypothetical protein
LIDGRKVPSGARQAGAAGLAGRQAVVYPLLIIKQEDCHDNDLDF